MLLGLPAWRSCRWPLIVTNRGVLLQAIADAVAVAIVDISGDCEVGGTGSACALGSGEVKAVAEV